MGDNKELQTPEASSAGTTLMIPVDLLRDEFIEFNHIVAKSSGKRRVNAGYLLFAGAAGAACLIKIISDWNTYGYLDLIFLALLLFVVVSGLITLAGGPLYIRTMAGRNYDETIQNGQSYYGRVYVFGDRIEKHGDKLTVLRYDGDLRYMETKDLMIFIAPGRPAVVLPARCLTREQADGIRATALPGIPAIRQKILGRLEPAKTGPISEPVRAEDEEELPAVRIYVEYTQEELRSMNMEIVVRSFHARLPLFLMAALMAAGTGVILTGSFLTAAIVFALVVAGLFGVPLIRARSAADRQYEQMEEAGDGILVRATEAGLTVRTPDRPQPRRFSWCLVLSASEQPRWIEFHLPGLLLRLPKRCMNQLVLDELRGMADRNIREPMDKKR